MNGSHDGEDWRAGALADIGFVGVLQIDWTTHKARGDGEVGRMFGVRPDLFPQGVCLDDLDAAYFGNDLDLIKRNRTALGREGGQARYEFRLNDRDTGGCRWLRTIGHQTVDRHGRLLQASVAVFDTTAHPPGIPGIYTSFARYGVAAGSPARLPMAELDQLSGQLIRASRGARALGLDGVEADLRHALASVGSLLSARMRTRPSH